MRALTEMQSMGREISLYKGNLSQTQRAFFHEGVMICQVLFYVCHSTNSFILIILLQGRCYYYCEIGLGN